MLCVSFDAQLDGSFEMSKKVERPYKAEIKIEKKKKKCLLVVGLSSYATFIIIMVIRHLSSKAFVFYVTTHLQLIEIYTRGKCCPVKDIFVNRLYS